jgi:transcriptional regulator with XRE-family HTH domain
MKPTQFITKAYRKQRGLSLRRFADALGGDSNLETEISHQSIKNWEDGVHEPDFSFLVTLALTSRDWRGDFAFDVLSAMKPHIYEPMTSIGMEAIEKYSVLDVEKLDVEKEK